RSSINDAVPSLKCAPLPQQYSCPLEVVAQAWERPHDRALKPPSALSARTGEDDDAPASGLPSWPWLLSPQHTSSPANVVAQPKPVPTQSVFASTATLHIEGVPAPKQVTCPSSAAHVTVSPDASARALPESGTRVGCTASYGVLAGGSNR